MHGIAETWPRTKKMNLQEVFRFMDSERYGVLTTATNSGPPRHDELEFAQGHGYWTDRRANCWKQATQRTHDQGENDAHQQQIKSNFEGECQVRKGLKVHGAGG